MTQIIVMEQKEVSEQGADKLRDFVDDFFAALASKSVVKLTINHNHPADAEEEPEENPYRFHAELEVTIPGTPIFQSTYGADVDELLKNFVEQAGAFADGPYIRVEGGCPSLVARDDQDEDDDDKEDGEDYDHERLPDDDEDEDEEPDEPDDASPSEAGNFAGNFLPRDFLSEVPDVCPCGCGTTKAQVIGAATAQILLGKMFGSGGMRLS